MFTQPRKLKSTGRTFHDTIRLADGETVETRFEAWLGSKAAELTSCCHHSRTRLTLTSSARFSRVIRHGEDICSLHDLPREPIPGLFEFHAAADCKSCRAAYAMCPPAFHEAQLDTFNTSTPERAAALARCREFVAQVNMKGCGWLVFVGKPGTGKTRLACGLVRELETLKALYVRQGELTLALRATYGRKEVVLRRRASEDDDTPPGPIEVAQAAPFLILDELGCTAIANDERLLLDELLKVRYDQHKPTVLISNLALDQLKEFLGDAIADRIRHATGNGKFLLQFSGESYRRSDGESYLDGIGDVPKASETAPKPARRNDLSDRHTVPPPPNQEPFNIRDAYL